MDHKEVLLRKWIGIYQNFRISNKGLYTYILRYRYIHTYIHIHMYALVFGRGIKIKVVAKTELSL